MTPITLVSRLRQIRSRLEILREFLKEQGFVFQYPDEVLPGPDERSCQTIERIEKEVGRVPEVLKQFYTLIGSVNFNGYHEDWGGCEYPDALTVFPVLFAETELDDFLVQKAEYLHAYGAFRIPIAPDYYHKEGVSGGMWYGVPVPAESEDPPLLEEPHNTTFLKYLEIATEWGGFPGLENAEPEQTWPLFEMRAAIGMNGRPDRHIPE